MKNYYRTTTLRNRFLTGQTGKTNLHHYILGMSKLDIARVERVNESAVRDTIERGLKNMEEFLKKV